MTGLILRFRVPKLVGDALSDNKWTFGAVAAAMTEGRERGASTLGLQQELTSGEDALTLLVIRGVLDP